MVVAIHVREYERRARKRTSAARNMMARFESIGSSRSGITEPFVGVASTRTYTRRSLVADSRVCDRVVVRVVLALRKDVETSRV